MSANFAASVLTLLITIACQAGALLSDIHETMTAAEILETFGTTKDSIPDYRVYPITLPGSGEGRAPSKTIEMKVKLDGVDVYFDFKATAGYLASNNTPVWLATTDESAYNSIRYDELPTAITDIGQFRMYQDAENEAAIVVYDDPQEGSIVEGILSRDFAIKSLPKSLVNEKLEAGDRGAESPGLKNSINHADFHSDKRYCAVFKIPASIDDTRGHRVAVGQTADRVYRVKRGDTPRRIPEVVYAEMLLILDYNAIRDRTITQALRFMVAFWNSADMVYSPLEAPKVRLSIAGIIIAADDAATSYMTDDTSLVKLSNTEDSVRSIGSYFYEERKRLPMKHYDMIIAMTTINLCIDVTDPCSTTFGFANVRAACTSSETMRSYRRVLSTAIVHYEWNFAGVGSAVHETGHLLGAYHDDSGKTNDCAMEDGHAMAELAQFHQRSFEWSRCSLDYFHAYFSSEASNCLDNPPPWMALIDETVPEEYPTLDDAVESWY